MRTAAARSPSKQSSSMYKYKATPVTSTSGYVRAYFVGVFVRLHIDWLVWCYRSVTTQVTGAINWRACSIKYKKNEVFLDVVEKLCISMSASGMCSRRRRGLHHGSTLLSR